MSDPTRVAMKAEPDNSESVIFQLGVAVKDTRPETYWAWESYQRLMEQARQLLERRCD